MLTGLSLHDLVLVDALDLGFEAGLTVVTGETGAGKSLLIDALLYGLGERADPVAIRAGSTQAEVALHFAPGRDDGIGTWLAEQALDADGEIVVRRLFTRDGRSRGFINGRAVPMQTLRALGERLIDIHGQHAHQSLLDRTAQRDLLDAHAGLTADVAELGRLAQAHREARERLAEAEQRAASGDERRALLEYQLAELREVAPQTGEWVALGVERNRLVHAQRLIDGLTAALTDASEHDECNARRLLTRLRTSLGTLENFDPAIAAPIGLVDGALAHLDEAIAGLRECLDRIGADTDRLRTVEDRLDRLKSVARKHRIEPEDLAGLRIDLEAELSAGREPEIRLAALTAECADLSRAWHTLADRIGVARRSAATTLASAVTCVLERLAMRGARFEVRIEAAPPTDELPATGRERIEFVVSANPGQPCGPLARVASGGELSRVALAIHLVTARAGRVPTLVFDEVDAGIGGATAEVVGQVLRELGAARQVMCITHLPQVAALGTTHLVVHKDTRDGVTRSRVQALDRAGRIDELARMMSGVEPTPSTRRHAEEMLERGLLPPGPAPRPRRRRQEALSRSG